MASEGESELRESSYSSPKGDCSSDNRRRDLEFEVGDMVFLRISPWKGVLRFGKRGKLSPRYIGPYRIVERIGEVAYRLEGLDELKIK